MITEYEDYCIIEKGKRREHVHHLIGGTANRQKSEKWGLTIPVTAKMHEFIHKNPRPCVVLCNIIGQLYFEKQQILQGKTDEEARELFRREFGQSWL